MLVKLLLAIELLHRPIASGTSTYTSARHVTAFHVTICFSNILVLLEFRQRTCSSQQLRLALKSSCSLLGAPGRWLTGARRCSSRRM